MRKRFAMLVNKEMYQFNQYYVPNIWFIYKFKESLSNFDHITKKNMCSHYQKRCIRLQAPK